MPRSRTARGPCDIPDPRRASAENSSIGWSAEPKPLTSRCRAAPDVRDHLFDDYEPTVVRRPNSRPTSATPTVNTITTTPIVVATSKYPATI